MNFGEEEASERSRNILPHSEYERDKVVPSELSYLRYLKDRLKVRRRPIGGTDEAVTTLRRFTFRKSYFSSEAAGSSALIRTVSPDGWTRRTGGLGSVLWTTSGWRQ